MRDIPPPSKPNWLSLLWYLERVGDDPSGEIRGDLSPQFIRQVILGSMEHVCLTGVIFHREISPDELTEDLCRFIFQGIEGKKEGG